MRGSALRPARSGRLARLAAAIPLALLLALAGPAVGDAAAQRSLVIERFHADVQVQSSGDLLITETLRPRFSGTWNGIVRHVELHHTTAGGERGRLGLTLLSATEGGRPLRTEVNEVDRDTREIRVWVPDAADRTAEVVIRYRVRGALRYFAGPDGTAADPRPAGPAQDYDEVYWEVTGTSSEIPIEDASARIVLPAGAAPLQAAAYRGRSGSGQQVEAALPGAGTDLPANEVVVPSSGYLSPGEGLTVAVAWEAGHVAVPAGVTRARPVQLGPTESVADAGAPPAWSASSLAWLPLLIPILVLWFAYRMWHRRGRDPRERAITVRWEPPESLSPAEAGTLVDHTPGMHDITSTLVDLAVRGYLVIEEREKKGFLQFGKDYVFHLVRPRAEWGDLARHETLFLNGLFSGVAKSEVMANLAEEGTLLDDVLEAVGGERASDGAPEHALESVRLSDLQNEFYKKLPGIKNALMDALVDKGHYLRRPDRVRIRWGLLTGAVFAAGFGAMPAFATNTATGYAFGLSLLVASGVSGLILLIFTILMPSRTEKGARTREATLGFKRFLEKVESPRYRRMIQSPDQFERYLPFAMAFRCADDWARAFDDLLTEPPQWYHGRHGAFRPTAFATDLGTLTSATNSALASSPSSSGSGGGGSVGGGSGGGGVGGF